MAPERAVHSIEARVLENRDLGAGYRMMRLSAPEVADSARPGNFLTLVFPGRTDPLLPRPFAFFDARPNAGEVDVLFKVRGAGTRLLARTGAGEPLRMVGPLGRPWRKQDSGTALLVAGGTAYAALHMLARDLVTEGRKVRVVWGQASEGAFPDLEAVGIEGAELRLATDDGSRGFRGTCVGCLEKALGEAGRAGCAIYGAGPVPMLRALADLSARTGLPCEVSLEARMACGIGACRGCVVNAKLPHPDTGLHRRTVCTDGPVFDAAEIDWENLW